VPLIEGDLLYLTGIELYHWKGLLSRVVDDRVALALAVLCQVLLPVQEVSLLPSNFLSCLLLLLKHIAPNADHLTLLS
jgi:hypothetical protein